VFANNNFGVIGTCPKNDKDLRNDKVRNLKKQYQLTKSKITKSNYLISIDKSYTNFPDFQSGKNTNSLYCFQQKF
jgi:hypothetical protein